MRAIVQIHFSGHASISGADPEIVVQLNRFLREQLAVGQGRIESTHEFNGELDNQCDTTDDNGPETTVIELGITVPDHIVKEAEKHEHMLRSFIVGNLRDESGRFLQRWECGNDHYFMIDNDPEKQ
ncbi:MAG TPA: hypothetical protein VF581_07790 [Flavobacterium sp.]|jgi:hypothetical protein